MAMERRYNMKSFVETEKVYAERLSEELKSFDFKYRRNKVLRNPNKMTFNPLEAEVQDLYWYILRHTSLKEFLRVNTQAKMDLGFALYLILVLCTLIGYIIYYATTL